MGTAQHSTNSRYLRATTILNSKKLLVARKQAKRTKIYIGTYVLSLNTHIAYLPLYLSTRIPLHILNSY